MATAREQAIARYEREANEYWAQYGRLGNYTGAWNMPSGSGGLSLQPWEYQPARVRSQLEAWERETEAAERAEVERQRSEAQNAQRLTNNRSLWPSSWRLGNNFEYPTLSENQRLFFDNSPEAAYGYVTSPAKTHGGTGFRSYLQRSGADTHNRYISDLATGNENQNTDFYSWMSGSGRFKPYEDFLKLSPYERGERPSAFAGRARWVL